MPFSTLARSAPPPRWWTQAWALVLAGGLVMGLALGVRHVQGLFLLPVTLERGWSRESFAFALALQNLVWGLAQPLAGMAADRWGARPVVGTGLALYALGLLGMSQAGSPLAFVIAGGVCIGIALSGTTFGVVYAALGRLVAPERRGWALGLAGAVGGLGQFLLVPTTQTLIGHWGWVAALGTLALVIALALPLAVPLNDRAATTARGASAAQPPQALRAAVQEAFAQRGFWLLNLGFLACGFQLAFVASHLPAWLLDQGWRAADGMAALALIALANVGGTYACGLLGARYAKKKLLAGVYLARSAAMALFVLLPLSTASLYLFALAMGALWLGTVPLTSGILAQVFGLRYLATLFGFVFFGHQLGSFLGVWLGGVVFEATGSYGPVWAGAIALGLLAAALHWPIDEHPLPRLRREALA